MNPADNSLLSERKFSEYCSVLGVTKLCCLDPDRRAIEKAFRRSALKCHPDKGGDPVVFKKLNDAYYKLIGHILKLQQQSELLELSQSILIEISKTALVKWQDKLRRRYGWFKSDNCKHIIFDGPYKQFMGRSKNTGNITVVLYEDPPDQIPKIHVRSRKYMAWIAESGMPVHLHVDKGRALQFDQWRIVHLAEFGICNFSEVSPSSFNKKTTNSGPDSPPPTKAAKRRKAGEEGEECGEVKQDLGETEKCERESEESNKETGAKSPAEKGLHIEQTKEAAEEKRFVCSSCGADFVNLMSLNFHRNSCVPPDFYDEFPSDIIDTGDLRTRNSNGVGEGENITERGNSTNISTRTAGENEGEVSTEDSNNSTASTRLSCGGNNNPHDESQHSNKIFNSTDERRGTAENSEREVNVRFKESSFVSRTEEKVNNEAAKSGPELQCREASSPALIDKSGAKGPTRSDISQINIAVGGQGSQRLAKNENYSETSELRIQGHSKERKEKDERPSKAPKNTEEKIQTGLAMGDEFKKMPQRSAFKKDTPPSAPTPHSATELMDTTTDEEVENLAESEYDGDLQAALLSVVGPHCQPQLAAGVSLQQSLHCPAPHHNIKPDLVTALPRRERNMEACYATYSSCQVLSKDKEIVTRKMIDSNVQQSSTISLDILQVEKLKVEKKLRELELDDIRSDYNFNQNYNQQNRSSTKTHQKQCAVELEENISIGTRKIVLSNTEVNKNRPKLLGPSRFGY